METLTTLEPRTQRGLHALTRANLDSARGFEEAARLIEHSVLRGVFEQAARERRAAVETLTSVLHLNAEEAPVAGSLLARLHRAWMDLRAAVNGGDAYVILIELERETMALRSMYEDTLRDTAGSPLNPLLLQHYARIKRDDDDLRALRDSFAKL